jgi:hypothetical protein
MSSDIIQAKIKACKALNGKPDNRGRDFVCEGVDETAWKKLFPFDDEHALPP